MQDIVDMCKDSQSQFTVAILNSGGCIDTIGAIRAQWRPIWGTEICPMHVQSPNNCQDITRARNCRLNLKQQIWQAITGTKSLGNTFSKISKYNSVERPVLLKSGQMCVDYCLGSTQQGANGETGWCYTEQVFIILSIKPLAVELEMADNATEVNDGKEVKFILSTLEPYYFLYTQKLMVYSYGDGSYRRRLIIIGFLRVLGKAASEFSFPVAEFNTSLGHTARDIAMPDELIPTSYWREDNTARVPYVEPEFGKIHYLATAGKGMGDSEYPNKVTSWDGIMPTHTTWNGNNRRPRLDWVNSYNDKGELNPVGPTRVTHEIETIRAASLPYSYREFIAQWDDSPRFLWDCVNSGVPVRTAVAIDTQIRDTLLRAINCPTPARPIACNSDDYIIKLSVSAQIATARLDDNRAFDSVCLALGSSAQKFTKAIAYEASNPGAVVSFHSLKSKSNKPRSALVDTGANRSLYFSDVEPWLQNSRPSKIVIEVADSALMKGGLDGRLLMLVLSSPKSINVRQPDIYYDQEVTTNRNLSRELQSVDEAYVEGGFNILLKQPKYEDGIPQMYRPAEHGKPEIRIPFRYDYLYGGFWMDYLLVHPNQSNSDQSKRKLQAFTVDMINDRSKETVESIEWFEPEQAMAVALQAYANEAVTEIFFGQHAEERTLRGVKAGLKKKKRLQNYTEFHDDFVHTGSHPNCWICTMVKGAMRRIYKTVDPYKETRPAYAWHWDTVTWSHRSFHGNKYHMVGRCAATHKFQNIYLWQKSDACEEFKAWVLKIRADPAHQDLPYMPVSVVYLDNAGEWELDNVEWQTMGSNLAVEFIYSCADRKESAGGAEIGCGVMEIKVKCGMIHRNLEPAWWEELADQGEFLLDRFPVTSQSVSVPIDGDRARPLELYTRGRYSRRQIDRELEYFLAVGTPALVHDCFAKGSTLGPKCTWMIALRMYREQVIFWSPKTKDCTKSKSYTAFKMRPGIHYTEVIGINQTRASQKARPLPSDFNETVVVQLPERDSIKLPSKLSGNKMQHPQGPPVAEVKHVQGDETEGQLLPAPVVTQSGPTSELRGSIQLVNSDGKPISVNPETGELVSFTHVAVALILTSALHCVLCFYHSPC